MTYDKCSCGARDKNKCCKENGLGGGKMCLKEYEPIPEELIERINIIRERAKMNQTFEKRIQSIENELKEILNIASSMLTHVQKKLGGCIIKDMLAGGLGTNEIHPRTNSILCKWWTRAC